MKKLLVIGILVFWGAAQTNASDIMAAGYPLAVEADQSVKLKILPSRLRRCSRNRLTILVQNRSPHAIYQAEARLRLPAYVVLVSASRPFTFNESDSSYRFAGVDLQAGSSEPIQIIDSVLCEEGLMGVNQCIEANFVYNTNLPSIESAYSSIGNTTYCLPITDSYDPNDKSVNPRGLTSVGRVPMGNLFEYTIRFQNLGNAEANQIVVVDTLDVNLDMVTFDQGPASHPYMIQVGGSKNSRVVKWTFSNINLPPASVDEIGSQGYVSFTIYPYESAIVGARIYNKADIYFDFNSPVRTNTTLNTLYLFGPIPTYLDSVEVGTEASVVRQPFYLFPNPTTGNLSIDAPEHTEGILYSMKGKRLCTLQLSPGRNLLSLSGYAKGVYLLRLGKGNQTEKIWLE